MRHYGRGLKSDSSEIKNNSQVILTEKQTSTFKGPFLPEMAFSVNFHQRKVPSEPCSELGVPLQSGRLAVPCRSSGIITKPGDRSEKILQVMGMTKPAPPHDHMTHSLQSRAKVNKRAKETRVTDCQKLRLSTNDALVCFDPGS